MSYDDLSQEASEGISPHPTVEISSQETTETVPCEIPKDKGTRHEIDLKPGSKYCVMKE